MRRPTFHLERWQGDLGSYSSSRPTADLKSLVDNDASRPTGKDWRQDRARPPVDHLSDGRGHGLAGPVSADTRCHLGAASGAAGPILRGDALADRWGCRGRRASQYRLAGQGSLSNEPRISGQMNSRAIMWPPVFTSALIRHYGSPKMPGWDGHMGNVRSDVPETAGSMYGGLMEECCDFRIFTAPAGGLTGLASLGVGMRDAYHVISLARKKSYKVANDTTHDKTFTIHAFSMNAENGVDPRQGALPVLIQEAMAQSPIRISSATGTVYVNISLKSQKPGNSLLKKLSFGSIVTGLKMIHGLWSVAQPEPNEVYFSITAMETESTKYKFSGEKTLNEINIALWRKQAFAFADPTTRGNIEAVVGALTEGLGADSGGPSFLDVGF